MYKPTCESCVYWDTWTQDCKKDALGLCRKNAPRRIRIHKTHGMSSTTQILNDTPKTKIDEWCGEHPDFPAYLESLKPSLLPQTIVCPKCGHMCTTDDAEIGKPCPRVDKVCKGTMLLVEKAKGLPKWSTNDQ
jgi:hypothetical protein